jgi:hypothetical protein
MISVVGQVSLERTQGGRPSLKPKKEQRRWPGGQPLRGMHGVLWGTQPTRGQNLKPPSTQNLASAFIAFTSAVELLVLKHCTIDWTHVSEKLEKTVLGLGGSSKLMRAMDASTLWRDAFTVEMTLHWASHSTQAIKGQAAGQPDVLAALHDEGHMLRHWFLDWHKAEYSERIRAICCRNVCKFVPNALNRSACCVWGDGAGGVDSQEVECSCALEQ